MPWGDNPTGSMCRCPYCGGEQIDDDNPPSHERTCFYRPLWRRVARLLRLI